MSTDHDIDACPTCGRGFAGRRRKQLAPEVAAAADAAATGELVGPAAAAAILGITATTVRRMDAQLQPVRDGRNRRLYDRGRLEALARAQALPASPPVADDLGSDWLSFGTVVRLTGLQEQTLRDADGRLLPRREPRADGTLGPRQYHRNTVYQELVRLGKVPGTET